VASSLKEVFEAVDDEDDAELDDPNQDPKEKVDLARARIRELKSLLESKSSDVDKLKKQNESLLHLKKVTDAVPCLFVNLCFYQPASWTNFI